MLTELEMQNRKAARKSFIDAAWEGKEPHQLLPLASDAGLTGGEADELIQRIRQGKEHIEQANRLPRLRKDAASTKDRFERVQSRAAAEIARLEGEVQTAALEADAAQKAVYAAEASSRRLLAICDEGLLAHADAPEEVLRLVERRDAEEESRKADQARAAAFEERNRRRAAVRNIEEQLANLPLTLTNRREERALRDQLKEARRQLAEAEARLKTAEAAADAARKRIP
jgi:hypothetical protein